MKKADLLYKYYTAEEKKFSKNLNHTYNFKDKEIIHDLRLSLKKIKSFLELIQFLNDEINVLKYYKQYKKIFKMAGSIRDIHIEEKMIETIEDKYNLTFAGIKTYLKELEEENKKNLNAIVSGYDWVLSGKINKKISKIISSKMESDAKLRVLRRINSYKGNIIKTLNIENLNEIHLHRFRRDLKNFMYSLNTFTFLLQNRDEYKKFIKEIDKIQELLGKWHDYIITVQKVKEYQKTLTDETEIHLMNFLSGVLEYEEKKMLEKINEDIEKYKTLIKDLKLFY
ncbi:MAG: CHAD domain-containing protein [Ignavibacteria bacterium]|nr:CHAD domain-containing protein [Ignavibacteria bacterium]